MYQRTGTPDWIGDLQIDNGVEITGTTGADGRMLMPDRSANGGVTTRTGHTLHSNPFGVVDVVGRKNRFLVKLSKGEHEEFVWLDITAFNLAYWQGNTISTFVISTHVPPPGAPARPASVSARIENGRANLEWSSSLSPNVVGYYVYRAAPPTYPYERISSLISDTSYLGEFSGGDRIYAVTAVDSSGRESGFGQFIFAPGLAIPSGVALSSDGVRNILDTHTGALLRQRSDGRYVQYIGSPHYNSVAARFLAVDAQDRFLISHAGNNIIRVADRDVTPLFSFGGYGTGQGQFQTPAGVASWGKLCSPYSIDEHTLLLLHFDSSYVGAQGQVGISRGTSFATGKYGQGVLMDSTDTLTYSTTSNLNRAQGTIEFWVRPNWNGGDGQSYTFFEVGSGWFNRMRIVKDGANNLRFMLWDSTTEYGVAYNVAGWKAGEWHHVAATWQGTSIALFVDGQQRDSSNSAGPPDSLAPTLFVGSSLWYDQQANAVVDEFRISDTPRSSMCGYRILVVDSGNHRIQAFDEEGNFVSAYSNYGSGSGQFNNPQGLTVDGSSRVIVADSGNNRLQVLGFDGTNWSFIQSITGSFSMPTGVAAYGASRIIVADTGNNQIKVLDADGNLLARYDAPNDDYGGTFNQPRGVTTDNNARIVVADTGNRRVATIRYALPIWLPTSAAIGGPVMGVVQTGYTFTASIAPITVTQPITYIWQTTGQSPVTHTGGLSDTVTFAWSTPDAWIITVTASNAGGIISNTHLVTINAPPSDVTVIGPVTGVVQVGYVFTAAVSPVTTTQPITYIWQATGTSLVTNTSGLSNTAAFSWTIPGVQTIIVTATNAVGMVTGTHVIIVVAGPLASVTIAPNPVTVTAGATQTFTVSGADAFGNAVSISPTWSTDAGTMMDNILTAQTIPASGKHVTATVGSVSGTAIVNVVAGPLASIAVTPNPVTVTVGTTQTFTASGTDAFGNAVPISSMWSTNAGAMTGNTLTAQTIPANGKHVTATVGSVSGTAIANIVAGPLASITVTPTAVTLAMRQSQQFSASGFDAYGNAISDLPLSWQVTPLGVGTIDATGLFTAGTKAGVYPGAVVVSSGVISSAADVIVRWLHQVYLPVVLCQLP